MLGSDGSLAAQTGFEGDDPGPIGELVGELFDHAAKAADGGPVPDQLEVALPEGSVFALRERGWTLAVVAGRFALSSLMFFDLRMVARDLDGGEAAT